MAWLGAVRVEMIDNMRWSEKVANDLRPRSTQLHICSKGDYVPFTARLKGGSDDMHRDCQEGQLASGSKATKRIAETFVARVNPIQA